eukprot:974888-Prymnesium_polylepis.1
MRVIRRDEEPRGSAQPAVVGPRVARELRIDAMARHLRAFERDEIRTMSGSRAHSRRGGYLASGVEGRVADASRAQRHRSACEYMLPVSTESHGRHGRRVLGGSVSCGRFATPRDEGVSGGSGGRQLQKPMCMLDTSKRARIRLGREREECREGG